MSRQQLCDLNLSQWFAYRQGELIASGLATPEWVAAFLGRDRLAPKDEHRREVIETRRYIESLLPYAPYDDEASNRAYRAALSGETYPWLIYASSDPRIDRLFYGARNTDPF